MKTSLLLLDAIYDLVLRISPQIRKRTGFAFLVHPRNHPDVYRKYPFFRFFSNRTSELILRCFWPVTLSRITGVTNFHTKSQVPGWVISIPITADQMMRDRNLARKFIIKAAKLAERRGAQIIGLGALTTSLTKGGLDILPHTKSHINTGRFYTSYIVTETAKKALSTLGLNKDITIAIVGACGSIGTASVQIFAKDGFEKFILVDLSDKKKKMNQLRKILHKINPDVVVQSTSSIEAIKDADVIIAATNKPDALIRSEHVKPGAIIVDDAQPSDIDEDILNNRKDVFVLEGGVAHTETVDTHFNFGLKHKEDIFSCLAETIILSSNGFMDKDFHAGELFELDFNSLNALIQRGEELGFRVGDFQTPQKVYSEEDIRYIRDTILENK